MRAGLRGGWDAVAGRRRRVAERFLAALSKRIEVGGIDERERSSQASRDSGRRGVYVVVVGVEWSCASAGCVGSALARVRASSMSGLLLAGG